MLKHRGTMNLETPRLLLRSAVMEDAQPMFENWASDEQVTKYLTWPVHSSVEVSRFVIDSWIAGYEQPDFYQWMIVLKEIGQPIGTISVVRQDERIGKMEIGYCIGRKWWHRGVVSETLKCVMDYLFAEVGVNRIEANHDLNNPNSGGVMRKCGMKFEGLARQSGHNNQGACDICQYALLKEEWNKYGSE